jgi:hypothetical protein
MQHSEDQVEEGNLGLWEYFTSTYDTQDFLDDGDEWNLTSNPYPLSAHATSTLEALGDTSSAHHGHQGSTAGAVGTAQVISHSLHFDPQANGYGQLTVQIAPDNNGNSLILPGQSAFYRPHESDETVSIVIQPNMLQLQQPASTNMASMDVNGQQQQHQQQQQQHYPPDMRCSIHEEHSRAYSQSSMNAMLYASSFNAHVAGHESGTSATSSCGDHLGLQDLQRSIPGASVFLQSSQTSATDWTRHNTNRQVETDDGSTGKPAGLSASMINSEFPPEHESLESCVNHGHFASCNDSKTPATCPTMSPMSLLPRAHDKRCKPLTGYNYFYRDERDNIVGNLQQRGDPLPDPLRDFSAEKMEQLLHHHW